jgi:hypothetical protein
MMWDQLPITMVIWSLFFVMDISWGENQTTFSVFHSYWLEDWHKNAPKSWFEWIQKEGKTPKSTRKYRIQYDSAGGNIIQDTFYYWLLIANCRKIIQCSERQGQKRSSIHSIRILEGISSINFSIYLVIIWVIPSNQDWIDINLYSLISANMRFSET